MTLESLEKGVLANRFLDVSLGNWLAVAVLWLAFAAALLVLRALLAKRFGPNDDDNDSLVADALGAFFRSTRRYFLVGFGLYMAVSTWRLPAEIVSPLGRVLFVLLLVQSIQWAGGLIDLWSERRLQSSSVAKGHIRTIAGVLRICSWIIVILLALDNFNIDITALITGLGIGGIAVALAVRGILSDLFAYFTIALDQPFAVGDSLVVGKDKGTVEAIGIRSTRVRSPTGELIVFPNSDLLASRVRNYQSLRERRIDFVVGVVYETPPEKLAAIPGMLQEIVERQEPVRFERAHFKQCVDSALEFEVVYHVLAPEYGRRMDIQQAINLSLVKSFADRGIEFAYPTQKIHIEGGQSA